MGICNNHLTKQSNWLGTFITRSNNDNSNSNKTKLNNNEQTTTNHCKNIKISKYQQIQKKKYFALIIDKEVKHTNKVKNYNEPKQNKNKTNKTQEKQKQIKHKTKTKTKAITSINCIKPTKPNITLTTPTQCIKTHIKKTKLDNKNDQE